MEVILLEDVKTLGKKGQIVKINDGYARNFVLPKKLGIEATPKNLNDLKLQKKREEKEAAEELARAKELAASIEDKAVTLSMKTGEGGKTFGTISTKPLTTDSKKSFLSKSDFFDLDSISARQVFTTISKFFILSINYILMVLIFI